MATGEIGCPEAGTKVAYVPYTASDEWFSTITTRIQQRAEECGVTLMTFDPAGDGAAQADGLDNLITSGVKAMTISAIDAKTIAQAVDRAKADGIYIVQHVASPIDGADGNVGVPEPEFGQMIGGVGGDWLLKAKPDTETYQVAILNADSLGAGLLDRKQGLIDGLEAALGGHPYEIVSDVEAFAEDTALDATSTILTAHPDLDLVLAVNDVGALGAVAAIESAGLKPGEDIAAVGSLTKRGLEEVVAGKMVGGITVPGAPHGDAIADLMFGLLTGQIQPVKDLLVPPTLITSPEEAQAALDAKEF
jgi:ABC-type sugar transport system substrate-binding protein